jgi:hypothetical protein
MKRRAASGLAAIEYGGVAGSSLNCEEAAIGLIGSGRVPVRARILTFKTTHCILLTDDTGDHIAIKSGFASGYGGTGPNCFSLVLQILDSHGCELSEVQCRSAVIERLDDSALTRDDLKQILKAPAITPTRLYDYILEHHFKAAQDGTLWNYVDASIPFALIDSRLFDLALTFSKQPDEALIAGYRKLEDRVRERTKLRDHGQKLFSKAFQDDTAPLYWKGIDDGERAGRINLFTGTYMAHRNPRAHRHSSQPLKTQLSEFLLLNHLFRLEREARGPRKKKKGK